MAGQVQDLISIFLLLELTDFLALSWVSWYFFFQIYKHMKYAKLLPVESNQGPSWLNKIKKSACITLKHSHFSPEWTSELNHYLDLKFTLSIADMIFFIRILYPLATNPKLNTLLVSHYMQLLNLLLQSETKLPTGSIELDWKPLWLVLESIQKGNLSNPARMNQQTSTIIGLIRSANRFFDSSLTINIMKNFIPTLNICRPEEFIQTIANLALFLPTTGQGSDWLEVIFEIWKMTNIAIEMDVYMIDLFSRLAYDQRFQPKKTGLRDEMVRFIFTQVVTSLELPIGENPAQGTLPEVLHPEVSCTEIGTFQYMSNLSGSYSSSVWVSLGRFVVYTLFDKNAGLKADTMGCLRDLCMIIEPFCHPSNSGQ
jgi:hypothetical protein